MYSFLIIAVIELIGTILRKWTYYAIAVFVALLSLTIVYMTEVIEYVPKVLSFLTKEPSFGLFMLKGLAVWFAIVVVSLVINRFTVYYKNQGILKTKNIVIICAVIGAVIMIVIQIFIILIMSTGESVEYDSVLVVSETPIEDYTGDFFAVYQNIVWPFDFSVKAVLAHCFGDTETESQR